MINTPTGSVGTDSRQGMYSVLAEIGINKSKLPQGAWLHVWCMVCLLRGVIAACCTHAAITPVRKRR